MFSSNTSQVSNAATYIEDVFSTWLYTGNGGTVTNNNGIDLSTYGGLVWLKTRTSANSHQLYDSARGTNYKLASNTTDAQVNAGSNSATFFTTGFSDRNGWSTSENLVSWTFRKQPKFFDVVTYTRGASSNISHALGSVPGFVVIKSTSRAGNWVTIARNSNGTYSLFTGASQGLQSTAAANNTSADPVSAGALTSTTFDPSWFNNSSVAGAAQNIWETGVTYVAYLFAHNAGGFGLTGTDNVISCGSFTSDSSGFATVNLGYEPQWLLVKASSAAEGWFLIDNMRGFTAIPSASQYVMANTSTAENGTLDFNLTSTGFKYGGAGGASSSVSYIYIAIRRGPMKTPTTGTSVYNPTQTSATSGTVITTGFPVDFQMIGINAGNASNMREKSRITGINSTTGTVLTPYLVTSSTAAEANAASGSLMWDNTGFQVPTLNSGNPTIFWSFGRAPGFFDEVCYTGTGVNGRAVNHNLQVAPELIITKSRGADGTYGGNWAVACSYVTSPSVNAFGNVGFLNLTDAFSSSTYYNVTNPTATQFTVRNQINFSGGTFVSYLFASCPGVSKVGSYTGTGSTQTINCGFAGGARFVLIKRTDSTGDWFVWDTARGMVAGTDPRLALNLTDAETNANWVYTTSVGFQIVTTDATVNASGGSYIYLAIA